MHLVSPVLKVNYDRRKKSLEKKIKKIIKVYDCKKIRAGTMSSP
jgi:hypothetical protein